MIRCQFSGFCSCGEPFGENLKLWLEDQFGNKVSTQPELDLEIDIRPYDTQSEFNRRGSWLLSPSQEVEGLAILPDAILVGPAEKCVISIADSRHILQPATAKFEMIPGKASMMHVRIDGNLILPEESVSIKQFHSLERLEVSLCDLAGNLVEINGVNVVVSPGSGLSIRKPIGIVESTSHHGIAAFEHLDLAATFGSKSCSLTIRCPEYSEIAPETIVFTFDPIPDLPYKINVDLPSDLVVAGDHFPKASISLFDAADSPIDMNDLILSGFSCYVGSQHLVGLSFSLY